MEIEFEGVGPAECFKVYRSRWYILSVLSILNFSNGLIWISFSNIADSTSIYFHASTLQVDLLSIVFMISTLALGVPAMWILDKYGLRLSLNIAAWTNCLGSVLRILSTLQVLEESKYAVLLLGQIISGCGQPFMIFAPTKLVAQWFAPKERILANAIGSLANPLGFSIGGLLSTVLVSSLQNMETMQNQMELMIGLTAIPACLGALMTFGVLNSEPPTRPSASATHEIEPFFWGLRMLAGMKSYLLLAVCYGTGVGIISSLVTIMNQLLIPQGYSNVFSAAGVCVLVASGFIGASVASFVADRCKNDEMVAKVPFCLGATFIIMFIILSHFPGMDYIIAIILVIAGFFCLSISPICLELSVESSYPVAVGTSAGIMVVFGQLMSALLTFLLSLGSQPILRTMHSDLTEHHEIINQYSLMSFMFMIAPTPLIFLIFFTSPNKRLIFEKAMSDIKHLTTPKREAVMADLMEAHERCACKRPDRIRPLLPMEGESDEDLSA